MNSVNNYHLRSMPYAKCHVAIEKNNGSITIILYSCSTEVIRVSSTGLVECSGTYSQTTARHINRFTRELLGRSFYFECKKVCAKYFAPWRQVEDDDGALIVVSDSEINRFVSDYELYGKKWNG